MTAEPHASQCDTTSCDANQGMHDKNDTWQQHQISESALDVLHLPSDRRRCHNRCWVMTDEDMVPAKSI